MKARHYDNKIGFHVFAAPALLDFWGSFFNFTGIALISASTYQIMKMSCMVFVVLLSVTLLNRRYSLFQYLSLAIVIAGFLVVTIIDVRKSDDYVDVFSYSETNENTSEKHMTIIGMLCLLAG